MDKIKPVADMTDGERELYFQDKFNELVALTGKTIGVTYKIVNAAPPRAKLSPDITPPAEDTITSVLE